MIYVNRVTNLSDARYCAGMGADWLGFVVDPADPDYVSPSEYQEMMGWVSGPKRVAQVTGRSPDANIIFEQYAPDAIHCYAPVALQEPIDSKIPLILEIEFSSWGAIKKDILALQNQMLFLVLTELPATEEVIQKLKIENFAIPILLKIARMHESNVSALITHCSGLMLQGEREVQPGLKDYDHLSEILEALEQ